METSGYSLESLTRFLEEASRRCRADHRAQQPETPSEEPVPAEDAPCPIPKPRYTVPTLDAAWERAEQAYEEGIVLTGLVTGWNRGGLLVRWHELQGFVPASQLREVPLVDNQEDREQALSRWIGDELELKIIELDRSRNRLVFSERATRWGPKDGDHVLATLETGQIRRGQVSNICDFGVFVDLGGVDGLIHLSELSWGRVSHPRDILQVGQTLDVYVISVDPDNRRIALSLKRLKPDPWSVADQAYAPGQVLCAKITNVVSFGAFAQIEEGLEGLIHISELAADNLSHPSEVVQSGDEVIVRILRIDTVNHRLGLSMRIEQDETSDDLPSDEPPVDPDWDTGSAMLY